MPTVKKPRRLSGDERRAAIIRAVRRLFADKGFDGTTTRELAKAAGISEALLFKHFPNKEALYSAMQLACCAEQTPGLMERLKALKPSAATLVVMVHLLVSRIVGRQPPADDEEAVHIRLILRSLMEDGDFARLFLRRLGTRWIPRVEECITAAVAAGDAVNGPVRPHLRGWFTHHLAVMLMIHLRPEQSVVDYGLPREALVEQVVWFALRGMGLKEEAIKRHYNPKVLAVLAD